jgi:Asparagine synthase
VAVRRRVFLGDLPLYYLSLFDDEIDARLEDFLSMTGTLSSVLLAHHPFALEPTDAVVVAAHDGTIYVWRGGAANFPLYWTCEKGSIVLSSALPVDSTRRLSVSGLLASVAVASVTNQNEPNLSRRTPLAGWFRCRRGAITHLSARDGYLSENAVDFDSSDAVALDNDQLVEALQSAASAFGRRQAVRSRALIELSGGFDSTIAAIAARRHGMILIGVSESFPYYEFRFEEGIQQAVADSLGISRILLDGTRHLMYAPSDWLPKLDEPAIGVAGLKRALAVARIASNEGVDRIFVGHGGDQLFAENLLDREPTPHPLDLRAFSDFARRQVERAVENANSDPLMRRSTITFSHDARFDVLFKEAFGIVTRSPFTDVAWIRCGLAWARLPVRDSLRSRKQILSDAFALDLPQAVTHRKGKVPWNGVTSRSYAMHEDDILTELDRVRSPLERVGLNMRWLNRRVRQLADGSKSSFDLCDKEVIGSCALASWLRSWGILHASDCGWSE